MAIINPYSRELHEISRRIQELSTELDNLLDWKNEVTTSHNCYELRVKQFSKTLVDNYDNIEDFDRCSVDIVMLYQSFVDNKTLVGLPPFPLTYHSCNGDLKRQAIKEYLSQEKLFQCEPTDIEIILGEAGL